MKIVIDQSGMMPWQVARAAPIAQEHAKRIPMCKRCEYEFNGSGFAVRCDKTVRVRLSDEKDPNAN